TDVFRIATSALVLAASIVGSGCGRKVDERLATPKSSARHLFQAMYEGDRLTAQVCAIPENDFGITPCMLEMVVSMRRATDAVAQRCGEEVRRLLGGPLDAPRIDPRQIENGVKRKEGETATIECAGSKTVLHLKHTKLGWRVDVPASIAP